MNKQPGLFVAQLFISKKKSLAVAESCTGGLLANLLTNTPGSSAFFLLGIVAYSNKAKTSLLKIPALIIRQRGAVSYQIAKLMAQNVRRLAYSDYGIGITGIAGPSGGTPEKPKGTVFIAVSKGNLTIVKKFHFNGTRLDVKRKTALKALSILKKLL